MIINLCYKFDLVNYTKFINYIYEKLAEMHLHCIYIQREQIISKINKIKNYMI
jgi:hypothetical protein